MPRVPKYAVEKTSVGLQFVIPGTEHAVTALIHRPEYKAESGQLVIPGAEQIAVGDLIRRKFDQPIMPRCRQRSIKGTGLFGMN